MPTKCKRRFRPPTEGEKQRVWISNLGDIVLREMASQPTNTEVRGNVSADPEISGGRQRRPSSVLSSGEFIVGHDNEIESESGSVRPTRKGGRRKQTRIYLCNYLYFLFQLFIYLFIYLFFSFFLFSNYIYFYVYI